MLDASTEVTLSLFPFLSLNLSTLIPFSSYMPFPRLLEIHPETGIYLDCFSWPFSLLLELFFLSNLLLSQSQCIICRMFQFIYWTKSVNCTRDLSLTPLFWTAWVCIWTVCWSNVYSKCHWAQTRQARLKRTFEAVWMITVMSLPFIGMYTDVVVGVNGGVSVTSHKIPVFDSISLMNSHHYCLPTGTLVSLVTIFLEGSMVPQWLWLWPQSMKVPGSIPVLGLFCV